MAKARNIYIFWSWHILLVSNLLPWLCYLFCVCMCVWGVCLVHKHCGEGCQQFLQLNQQKLLENGQKCSNCCGEHCGSHSVWFWLWALSSYWQAHSHCLWIGLYMLSFGDARNHEHTVVCFDVSSLALKELSWNLLPSRRLPSQWKFPAE